MKFIAKTLYGLEQVVADELKTLGATGIAVANRAVVL
jgi:23S rRNA G2445 N2-methylase RlmL